MSFAFQRLLITSDPYCNCGVDKFGFAAGWEYNDIWLDIVVILDTSEAMGREALEDVSRPENNIQKKKRYRNIRCRVNVKVRVILKIDIVSSHSSVDYVSCL